MQFLLQCATMRLDITLIANILNELCQCILKSNKGTIVPKVKSGRIGPKLATRYCTRYKAARLKTNHGINEDFITVDMQLSFDTTQTSQ